MTGARILLVEDSDTQALQIRLVLEAQGFGVDRHATAEGALESLNEGLPDLVIADFHLPGMNGDELIRQMRLNVQTRAIPVLMLTEARTRSLERQGLESGADAYVPKGADQELILLRIKALLRQRGGKGADGERRDGASPRFALFRRARILLVADARSDPAQLADHLVQEGHMVEMAAGATQALAAATRPGASWDCAVVDATASGFDGLALARRLDDVRTGLTGATDDPFQIVVLADEVADGHESIVQAFAAGADDVVPRSVESDVLGVRVRASVRRKLLQDENRRIERELAERELAVANARAETAAAEAKASVAGALEQANRDLEDANHKLKEAQTKLVQAAKMASLGELVAGIAHEINNPLAFILAHQGTVERLLADVEAGLEAPSVSGIPPGARPALAKSRERVRSMRLGLTRIQNLVVNLRKFSRLDEGEFQTVDVRDSIDTVLTLLTHKLGDRIRVEREHHGATDLFCSPALLNQVVMNVIGNAADAIPGEGVVRIATRAEAETFVITISDNGPGVPEALRERIFEPFFTTKPVGSGTGLGLAIAYSVVQAHKGSIVVEAAPGGGACFVISIPRRMDERVRHDR